MHEANATLCDPYDMTIMSMVMSIAMTMVMSMVIVITLSIITIIIIDGGMTSDSISTTVSLIDMLILISSGFSVITIIVSCSTMISI